MCYIITPYLKRDVGHTNVYEMRGIVQVLLSLGFAVDMVDYRSYRARNKKKYAAVVGFGPVFDSYLGRADTKKLYYATGAPNYFQHWRTHEKLAAFFKTHGEYLPGSARSPLRVDTDALIFSDAVLHLGTDFNDHLFRQFNQNVVRVPAPIFDQANQADPPTKDWAKMHRNILWVGGRGAIHKGLDLYLQQAERVPNLTFHVLWDIEQELGFFEAMRRAHAISNVVFHGYRRIGTKEYLEVVSSCGFVVCPSVSEGVSTSVLCAALYGGCLAIVSPESNIPTEVVFRSIDSRAPGSLGDTLADIESGQYPVGELNRRSMAAREFLEKCHGLAVFESRLAEICRHVLV